jgi:branched-subunit amino acid transport protein
VEHESGEASRRPRPERKPKAELQVRSHLAALMAVVVPEIVLVQGEIVSTWRDARLWAAAAGLACFFWRRGILGTIVAGMAVYLPLRVGLGW